MFAMSKQKLLHRPTKILLVFLLIVSSIVLIVFPNDRLSARYSINSGQRCSNRGQIRDFQAQRFLCMKVNAKAGASSGASLVWVKISYPKSTTKSTKTTTTTTTTTTTVKKTCQDGGTCKIGDRGPGGGFVFEVNAGSGFAPGGNLEIAPSCVNYSHYPADKYQLDAIQKFPNTYKPSCPYFYRYQLLAAADAYYTETKDDWFLPSREQLELALQNLYLQMNPPLILTDCAKDSTGSWCGTFATSSSSKPDWYWVVGIGTPGQLKTTALYPWEGGQVGGNLIPIRSFASTP